MKDWYNRQEVADLLGVSKATVYHYAKQKKIIKIEDPYRLIREVRYKREEVDELAEERKRNEPTGLRPSELAAELNVTTQRIYALIQETELHVDELLAGDERMIYSIPEEAADWIRSEIERTVPVRGTRAEFYNVVQDIVLYQRFQKENGQDIRVLRNEKQEWGFYLQAQIWVPFADGIETYGYEPAYPIHQETKRIKGYTDFKLPKDAPESFDFLDFVYKTWGIENIRLREYDMHMTLSIKSGEMLLMKPIPGIITQEVIEKFLVLGDVVIEDDTWNLVSGYRRTTFDLPTNMLDSLQRVAKESDLSMSEYVEEALREKFEQGQ